MNIGLQLYGPIANWQGDLKELLKGIREIGFTRVEPCISLDGKSDNKSFWNMEICREIFPYLQTLGLEVLSAHVASENYADTIEEMIELSQKFGVKQLIVGMPELNKEAIEKRGLFYCELADKLMPYGIELLVHNGKPDIAIKVCGTTAYEYIVDVCKGKVGIQFDTGWAARGGEDPLELMHRNSGRMKSLHFKDFDMRIDTDVDTCIGDGTLNNEGFMKLGKELSLPMFVDADRYDSVLEEAEKSYQYLLKIAGCK